MSRRLQKAQEKRKGTVKAFNFPPAIYRFSTIGKLLRETLEEFKAAGKITDFVVQETLKGFDRTMAKFTHLPQPQRPLQFTAESVEKYKLRDTLWQLNLRNVVLNPNSRYPEKLPQLGIVASNGSDQEGFKIEEYMQLIEPKIRKK